MRPEHASAPLALLGLLGLSIAVLHGAASCTLDPSGTAASEVFAGASASSSGSGGATATSSSGNGGGTLVGSTTATGSTSSTMTGSEDCLDGQDNDGNGNIDCGDGSCQDFECVDQAPSGWDYVRVHTTPFGMGGNITCPDGSAPLHYFQSPGGPAQCGMCQCGVTGASCGAPGLSCYFSSTMCGGMADLTLPPTGSTACIGDPNVGNTNSASCRVNNNAMVLMQGTCTASGGMVTSTPPLWGLDVFICGGPDAGAGCATGEVCIPPGGGDFSGNACITRAGTDACPTGWTATQTTAYGSATDNRACSSCTCTTGCTGGGYIAHDLDSCGTPGGLDHPNTQINSNCVDIGTTFDNNSGSVTPQAAQPQATCAGGAPTGQVTPGEPHVICCR